MRHVILSLISSFIMSTVAAASESPMPQITMNSLSDNELAYSLGSKPGVNRAPGILGPPIYDETQVAEPAPDDESNPTYR